MDRSQHRLIIAGLAVILAGFLYGMGYTIMVEHEPRMFLRDNYAPAFAQLADAGTDNNMTPAVSNSIERINIRSVAYQRAIGAHTHAIYLGLLAVIIGLLIKRIPATSRHSKMIAICLGGGIVIYPLGLALQAAGLILPGEALALVGSLSVVISVALLCMGAQAPRTSG